MRINRKRLQDTMDALGRIGETPAGGYLNGALSDRSVPFGSYKQSANGREHGIFGLEEYLEVKAILGG